MENILITSLYNMITGIGNASQINHTPLHFTQSRNQRNYDLNATKSNFRSTSKNFSMNVPRYRQQNASKMIFKEPEIWDIPSQFQRKKSIPKNINKPATSVTKPTKNFNINKPNPKISQKKIKNNQQPRSQFLFDRYPNGQGPDSNLIQMLQKDVLDSNPNVTFDDIAQLQKAKELLQQAVLLPLKMPHFFTGIRRAWKGVLMFGPPGTGKTLLAKAVASYGKTKFFNVSASTLASKWKGQSQKLVRILFQMAKFYAPSVIFFDQIDALGGRRKDGQDQSNRKVKTQLLVQMDGATSSTGEQNKFVIVLAATNRPWDLDQALRRRLQKRIYIPLPNAKGRQQLVKINMKSLQVQENLDVEFIINKTQGYSGADITNLCRQAAYVPLRNKLKNQGGFKNITDLKKFQEQLNIPIKKQDFLVALKNVNKSVGQEDLKKYQNWMKQFGTV